jgi:hypothetical protein
MKIFIPSYNRATLHTTPALLNGYCDYKVVVRPSQYKEYAKYLPKRCLLAMPTEGGLNAAREFTRTLLKNGEWCLHIDDDVTGFIRANMQFYRRNTEVVLEPGETMITRKRWQATLCEKVDASDFLKNIVEDSIREADKRGAYLVGFAAHENPAFRARKYTDVGYVCGGMMLMRKQPNLPWSQTPSSPAEDYALTAAHLFENGRVLVNKWGRPCTQMYKAGGCGPYLERLPAMLQAQQQLLQRYGALLGAKNEGREGKRQGELRIRMRTVEQVEQWRAALKARGVDPNNRLPVLRKGVR